MPQAAAHRGLRAFVASGLSFPEVGLHQCRSEKKGQGEPARGQHVPSHVPSHAQTAAKARGFSPAAPGCTAETDSPLEGAGFEPSVPHTTKISRPPHLASSLISGKREIIGANLRRSGHGCRAPSAGPTVRIRFLQRGVRREPVSRGNRLPTLRSRGFPRGIRCSRRFRPCCSISPRSVPTSAPPWRCWRP